MDRYKITAITISIVVVITIIAALQAIDNPLVEAEQKKDQKRVQDFTQIYYEVQNYHRENKKLPANIDELQNLREEQKIDAITKKLYEYQTVDENSFKLCTEFATDSADTNNNYREYAPNGDIKNHNKGYDCIEYTVEDIASVKPLPL